MMATRRRRRRRNRTPLFLLLLLLLAGMVLLLISCGGKDGEGLDGDGEPTQGDAANPGDTEGEGDIQEPEEPEPDPYEGYTIRTTRRTTAICQRTMRPPCCLSPCPTSTI